MYSMTILSPGPLSTVQDEGRFGYMSTGFSPGGAMDTKAAKTANILVGNAPSDGVIEMTVMGLSAQFSCDTLLAITGADMAPEINGEAVPMYRAIPVHAGDTLTMKLAKSGMRSYLAVAGGFDLRTSMGSMSTNLKCALGGMEGRKLQRGDVLPLRRALLSFPKDARETSPETYAKSLTVRVILGPQDDFFTEKGLETFLSATYTVTDKSDRMGVRLDGEKIENKNGVDIISDGIATGSIQIPASGTPIIMMADRQTTGGYAKIATVITADLPKIAQAAPGTEIRFTAISQKEAVRILRKEEGKLKALEYRLLFKD